MAAALCYMSLSLDGMIQSLLYVITPQHVHHDNYMIKKAETRPTDPPELFAFLRGRIEANIFSEISDSLYTQDDLFEMPADGMTTERVDSVRNFHCAVDVRLKLLYGVLRRYLHDDEGSNVNIVLENARDLLLAHMKTHCDVERAYVLYFSGLKHGLINHELPHFRRKSVDSYDNESEYIESVRGRAVSERRYYYLLSVEPR
ncbi:hypothetical protein SeLEV6574_g00840 [Synchytrium endobioticum]|uniref:Uncharacterized protein n=1 Tax=Synchytrium endobioticum TaxID=286115 RepID=A0A507DGN8_9FUNG|nr:hypothetical protein SeLEV6574_g00840 [Synchytrium endobioticum]